MLLHVPVKIGRVAHAVRKSVCLTFCLGILSSCSHEVAVTYESDPSGATVYEQDVASWAHAPSP